MNNESKLKTELDELSGFVSKLNAGELTIHELVELEQVARSIHEKTIILKYKAFEQTTGKSEQVITEAPEELVKDEPVEETIVDEMPAIEFSIFDDEQEKEILDEESDEASVIEEEPTPIEQPELKEEPIVEAIVEKSEPELASSSTSFWEQLNIQDNSLSSQFAGSKLDTLIGAFGLNEKLRYINDLFDGSSELFSDAVKLLDTQSDLNAAKSQIDKMASEHSWDPDEETVVEFMAYVNRRYA